MAASRHCFSPPVLHPSRHRLLCPRPPSAAVFGSVAIARSSGSYVLLPRRMERPSREVATCTRALSYADGCPQWSSLLAYTNPSGFREDRIGTRPLAMPQAASHDTRVCHCRCDWPISFCLSGRPEGVPLYPIAPAKHGRAGLTKRAVPSDGLYLSMSDDRQILCQCSVLPHELVCHRCFVRSGHFSAEDRCR